MKSTEKIKHLICSFAKGMYFIIFVVIKMYC